MKNTIFTLSLLLSTTLNSQVTKNKIISNSSLNSESKVVPPFIGTKFFITDVGSNGRNTPQFYMTIKKNGNVYIGYYQVNSATKEETREEIHCGKFQTYLTVTFKEFGNYKYHYKVIGNKVFQVDSNRKVLKSNSCCYNTDNGIDIPDSQECDCAGSFF